MGKKSLQIDRLDWSWKRTFLLAFSLLVAGFLLYRPSLHGPFIFDDYYSILTNRAIQLFNLKSIWNFTRSRFLTYLTFALNWHISAEKTFSYHLFNTCLHLVNTLLVWLLVYLLVRQGRSLTGVSFTAALVFLVHPVQTQAVSYIVQRATSLATFFYILATIFFLKYRQSKGKKTWWYLAAFITTVTGMFTKEIFFTLPLMLLVMDRMFFPEIERRTRLKHHFLFLLTMLVIPGLLASAKRNINLGELARLAEPAGVISPFHYFFTQLRVMVTYLRLLIFPLNQRLDYQYTLFHSFFHLPIIASFLLLLIIAFLATAAWQKGERLAVFGVIWFFLALSVESSFIPIADLIFEHRLYLPVVGYALVITGGFWWCQKHGLKRLALAAISLLVIGYSLASYQRNCLWADDLSLWLDTASKSPNKPRVLNNLAAVYNNRGRYRQAISVVTRGIFYGPRFYPLYLNRGRAFMETGNLQAALKDFLTALKINPDTADVHINVAALYAQLNDYQKALFHHRKSIELLPDSAAAYNNRASTYTRMGQYELAIADCEKALSLNPRLPEAYFNLGSAWEEKGNKEKAIKFYTKAIELKPDYFDAYTNRATTYRFLGEIEKAIEDFTRAISLQPDNAGPYNNRGNIYLEKKEYDKAIADYNAALKIDPGHSVAHFNRAVAYFNLRNYQQAREDVRKAQELGLRVPADFLQLLSSVKDRP
ncbi:MAG: tetratricopeptide repeat protein [Candidatus Omnitrophica bacterium]|nr:tetratricopeptide repeat protein [Candidatus Omnitrophota bacterium]